MDSLKDQLVKKGIVSQERVREIEQAEKQAKIRGEILKKKRLEKERIKQKAINLLMTPLPLAGIRPTNLEGMLHLGNIIKDIIKDHAMGYYRNHKCCICEKEGTSRIESCRAHSEIISMPEFKSFKFIFDMEESKKFAKALINKIGILLDEVNKTPLWICIPCKENIIEGIELSKLNKYLKLVEPYINGK